MNPLNPLELQIGHWKLRVKTSDTHQSNTVDSVWKATLQQTLLRSFGILEGVRLILFKRNKKGKYFKSKEFEHTSVDF